MKILKIEQSEIMFNKDMIDISVDRKIERLKNRL